MRKRTALLLGLIGLLLASATGAFLAGVEGLAALAFAAAAVLIALWLGVKVFRRLLWSVGRRLAFSYFLIGVLPIPLVVVLVGLAIWVFSGSLVGHLFRDTAVTLQHELEESTADALERFRDGRDPPQAGDGIAYAYYREGRKVAGYASAPERWPEWMMEPERDAEGLARHVPYVVDGDGDVTIAAAVAGGEVGALAVFTGELDRELRERSGVWVELQREAQRAEVEVFGREVALGTPAKTSREVLREQFFGTAQRELPWLDRPILYSLQVLGEPHPLSGDADADLPPMGAVLNATPRTV